MKKNNLKKKIIEILRDFPITRNSDITLMIELWKRYYQCYIKKDTSGEFGIYLSSLYFLPREDEIKRLRALIQNEEHHFLPTEEKVRKQRRIKEEDWRSYINSQTEFKRL